MKNESSYRSPTYYELAAPVELDWRKYRGDDYFIYRQKWDERAKTRDASSFPLHLDIDPTNRCNLKCSMCPRTYYINEGRHDWNPGGLLGDMDFRLYEQIINEGSGAGLKSVKFNFLGEPLLYKRLIDMISMASKAGLWVMINTNATLLDAHISTALLEAGLTDIFFSFDSPYPVEYEKIRQGANYDKTLNNIKTFMGIKTKMKKYAVQTRASMVLPENTEAEVLKRIENDYVKLFRNMGVAEIGFGLPSRLDLDYEKTYGLIPGFICPDIFRRMFIFWDGPVGPCCGDWERKLIMGDATKNSLTDIWQGEAYQSLREAHCGRNYQKIKACRACSVPYLSTV